MTTKRVVLAMLALMMVPGLAPSAKAAPRQSPLYTLRVRLLTGVSAGKGHTLHGVGNVLDGDQARGMTYSLRCAPQPALSDADGEYQARWTRRGRQLEIAINDGTKLRHCALNVALKNAVYVRQGDEVKLLSIKEYSGTKGAKASKALRMASLSAAEADPKRYPLQMDVMTLIWRDPVDGLQTGRGQGNMMTERGLAAVDFTIGCPMKLDPLPDGHFYHARWRGEAGTEMILLVEVPGNPSAVCELSTTVLPEVYLRLASGALRGVPTLEYQRMLRNDANVASRF